MKTLYILLLSLFVFSFTKTQAGTIIGAELSYKATSTPGVYEITFVHYLDCSGIGLCSGGCGTSCSIALQIMGADPGCASTSFGTLTVNLTNVMDVQDNLNPLAKNICTNLGCTTAGSYNPGFEKYTFQGLVNLSSTSGIPSTCCNVRIVYSNCCRNGRLPAGLSSQNYYTDITINRCVANSTNNNGPSPVNDAMLVSGPFQTQYHLGMFDPEGDSISYELTPALSAYNTPLSYTNPFAAFGSSSSTLPGTMNIGAQDGILEFSPGTPTVDMYGIVAMKATEWKTINGTPTAVSVTRRDFQSFIQGTSISNNPPFLQTFPNIATTVPKQNWMVCAGEQLCFTITAKDFDANDSPNLSFSIPPELAGATITNLSRDPNRTDSVLFCWTSDSLTTRETQYSFIVKSRDNRIPIDGKSHYRFTITVEPKKLIDQIVKSSNACNLWSLAYTKLPNVEAPKMITNWRISSIPNDYSMVGAKSYSNLTLNNLTFQDTGKYLVELTLTANPALNTCADVRYDTIEVTQTPMEISLTDTSICTYSSTTLTPTIKNKFGLLTYNWMNLGSSTVFNALSSITVSITNTPKVIVLKVTDGYNCIDYDTVTVAPKPFPVLAISQSGGTALCLNQNSTFINTSSNSNIPGIVFTWKLNDTIMNTGSSLQFTAQSLGTYNIKLLSQVPAGCKDSITLPVTSYSTPISSFTINNDTQCLKGNVFELTNTSSIVPTGNLAYTWLYGNEQSSIQPSPSIVFSNSGRQSISLIATSAQGCRDTSVQMVQVHPQPVLDFSLNTPSQCLDRNQYTAINLSPNQDDLSYSYSWTSENGTSLVDTFVQTFASPGTKFIQLNVETNLGCRDSLVLQAFVAPLPVASFNINQMTQCLNSNQFEFTNTANNVDSILWNINGQNQSGNNVTSHFETIGPKLITQNVFNAFGCSNFIQKSVEVLPSPVASITVNDFDQCENVAFTFTDSNQMTPPFSLNSSFIFSDGVTSTTSPLTRTFNAPGTYIAKTEAVASNGCMDTDSIEIVVFAKPQPLMIAGPRSVTVGTPQTYLTTNSPGYVYNWFAQDGVIESGNGTHQVSVKWTIPTTGELSVMATNDNGCLSDTTFAAIEITPNSGVNEVKTFADVHVFPNPARDQIMVNLQSLKNQTIKLTLVNVLGETIQSTSQKVVGNFDHTLNTSELPRGLYFLSIAGESSTQTFKIVLR